MAANFQGFLGAGRLRPDRVGEPWHVVFRFDSAQHLVEATDMHRVSGLETWFSLPGRTAPAPPKWKMFVVSATVFYLLNLTLSVIYGWELMGWPLPLRIALVSVPVTAIATWLVMPRAARLLQAWLYAPPPSRPDQQRLRGSTG